MNNTKKTGSFLRAINKYAKEQKAAMDSEVEQFRAEQTEKATQEGLRDAYSLIQKEIAVKKTEITSDLARREQASRKQLFIKRQQLVDKVFEEARAKLTEYTKQEQYLDYLKKSAEEISMLFADEECIVYISNADADKADAIKSIIKNCNVQEDSTIQIGGLRAFCEKTGIVADNTLDTRLEDQKAWFCENSSLKVV